MTADRYICQTCSRAVDPDEAPSPGEPRYCGDCYLTHERTERLMHGLAGWGRSQ